MKVINKSIELIGNTPMQVLHSMQQSNKGRIWGKLEFYSPGSSVKDRIAVYMIEQAEKQGLIKPGGTIIEATAGNTGIGLAVAASAMNYKFICIMPENYSIEKQKVMEFLGAEVIRTPIEDGMRGSIQKGFNLQEELDNAWMCNQFENTTNIDCHYHTTGPEIWEQTKGKVAAVVLGAGTGGTFTGIARFLKEKNPAIKAYVADPEGSAIGGGKAHIRWVEGIGDSRIPDLLYMDYCDGIINVSDKEAKQTIKKLALKEQLMVGGSSGVNVFAAQQIADGLSEEDIVITLLPDRMERYISKGILDI